MPDTSGVFYALEHRRPGGRLCLASPVLWAVLALVLLAPAQAAAGTLYVDELTCPAAGSGTPGDPFCSIQAAICVAVAGDTVSVAPGTYPEAIRMRPAVSVISTGGPQVTTIDASGQPCTTKTTGGGEVAFCTNQTGSQCSVVTFASGHTNSTVLDGFTITGGAGLSQTAILGGGGVFIFSSPLVQNNIIENNILSGPNDTFGGAGIFVSVGEPVITGNVIRGNQAIPPAGQGQSLTFSYGAGILVGFSGGGTINSNVIENNTAGDPALNNSAGFGAGILIIPGPSSMPTTVVDSNSIINNAADTFGGGIGLTTLSGSVSATSITNNVIAGNNSNVRGGGIYTYFSEVDIINNTILDNESVNGGGLYTGVSDTDYPVAISNNIFDGNTLLGVGVDGGGIYTMDSSAQFDPSIENNDFFNNEKNHISGDITDAELIGFNGNFDADPLFVNRAGGDYHLDTGSPAIDTALAAIAPPLDIEGITRGVDGDGTPNSPETGDVDIGAYETGGSCVPSTEVCDGVDNNCDGQTDEGFPDTDLDELADCVDPDDDNDTVPDGSDNCPLVANLSQLDLDGDTIGDLCDPDADGDGMVNGGDCSPFDPVFNAAPASAPSIQFALDNPQALEWLPVDGGRVFSVYSWDYAAAGGFSRSEACQGMAAPGYEQMVPEIPAPGMIRGYLLTAVHACGEGPAGQASDSQQRTVIGGCEDPLLNTDGDGYADLNDNCPTVSNTDQADEDNDGIGDACDGCPGGALTDGDGDGLCDATDNCPLVANIDQADLDGDGAGDRCDADADSDGIDVPFDPQPLDPTVCGDSDGDTCDDCVVGVDGLGPAADSQPGNDGPDQDGDGLCDAGDADMDGDGTDNLVDNCPLIANDQTDTDGDGDGNACDADDDNDGFDDVVDNCPLVVNDQANTDGDLQGDACDADDDNDGVIDTSDTTPLNPALCGDTDSDTCDDCAVGLDGFGPGIDSQPDNDGPDLDADGLCDAGDNCPLIANDQTNTDGDAQGDACDDDDDNDGLNDGVDNCPLDVNLDQLDRDLDGAGNPCDTDADGDGMENGLDCSPLDPIYNAVPPAVGDTVAFADAIGNTLSWDAATSAREHAVYTWDFNPLGGFQRVDACMGPASTATSADVSSIPAPGMLRGYLVTAANACGEGSGGQETGGAERVLAGGCYLTAQDTDGDGYPDLTDNCPAMANPTQVDTDLDGVGDACAP